MAEEKEDWIDPDDAPEITDQWFEGATLMKGDEVIQIGKEPQAKAPTVPEDTRDTRISE